MRWLIGLSFLGFAACRAPSSETPGRELRETVTPDASLSTDRDGGLPTVSAPSSLALPPPPGAGWERFGPSSGLGGWDTRRDYPSGYTSPLRERYTAGPVYTQGTIVEPIASYRLPGESIAVFAYRVKTAEPTTIVEHCCPDGGSDLFLAVSGKASGDPILLVAWGVEATRARRQQMLTAWAKKVEDEYIDKR